MTEDDGFDDLPSTHLDDDDYDEYVAREFDSEGRMRGGPPIGWIVLALVVVLLVVMLFMTR